MLHWSQKDRLLINSFLIYLSIFEWLWLERFPWYLGQYRPPLLLWWLLNKADYYFLRILWMQGSPQRHRHSTGKHFLLLQFLLLRILYVTCPVFPMYYFHELLHPQITRLHQKSWLGWFPQKIHRLRQHVLLSTGTTRHSDPALLCSQKIVLQHSLRLIPYVHLKMRQSIRRWPYWKLVHHIHLFLTDTVSA